MNRISVWEKVGIATSFGLLFVAMMLDFYNHDMFPKLSPSLWADFRWSAQYQPLVFWGHFLGAAGLIYFCVWLVTIAWHGLRYTATFYRQQYGPLFYSGLGLGMAMVGWAAVVNVVQPWMNSGLPHGYRFNPNINQHLINQVHQDWTFGANIMYILGIATFFWALYWGWIKKGEPDPPEMGDTTTSGGH